MKAVFARRFAELHEAMIQIPYILYDSHSPALGRYSEPGNWRGWGTSVQNLLHAVYGEASPYIVNFNKAFNSCTGRESDMNELFSLFSSAKDDFNGGYVFDVDLRISGEVFGDFVALARTSLSEGNKDVAAVLACAALEDALKRYAAANDLSVEGKTMADVVNALKSAGLVGGAQKTLLEAMPRIRNLALHGDWAKLSEPDVASVLGFVESFLLTKFSDG